MLKKIFLLIFIVLCFVYPVNADETKIQDFLQCLDISNEIERVNCYDNIAKDIKEKNIAKKNKEKNIDLFHWFVSEKKSKWTDKNDVIIQNLAIDSISGRFGRSILPSLVIRCQDNKTEAYVNWGIYLGIDSTYVTERIDSEKTEVSNWTISTDYEATFKNRPINFIKKLFGKNKLLLKVSPYGENPKTVEFNISGLEDVIQPLRNSCGW